MIFCLAGCGGVTSLIFNLVEQENKKSTEVLKTDGVSLNRDEELLESVIERSYLVIANADSFYLEQSYDLEKDDYNIDYEISRFWLNSYGQEKMILDTNDINDCGINYALMLENIVYVSKDGVWYNAGEIEENERVSSNYNRLLLFKNLFTVNETEQEYIFTIATDNTKTLKEILEIIKNNEEFDVVKPHLFKELKMFGISAKFNKKDGYLIKYEIYGQGIDIIGNENEFYISEAYDKYNQINEEFEIPKGIAEAKELEVTCGH